jgi:hypothetical protein
MNHENEDDGGCGVPRPLPRVEVPRPPPLAPLAPLAPQKTSHPATTHRTPGPIDCGLPGVKIYGQWLLLSKTHHVRIQEIAFVEICSSDKEHRGGMTVEGSYVGEVRCRAITFTLRSGVLVRHPTDNSLATIEEQFETLLCRIREAS